MSTTSKARLRSERSAPQQSDIIIDAQGRVHVSFLWDDLTDLADLPSLKETEATRSPVDEDSRSSQREEVLRHLSTSGDQASCEREYESCRLCPKQCGFNRVSRRHPSCGDHELRVSNSGVTFGDQPMIRGTRGSGAIMLSGCPLKCPSCHNPEKVADGGVTSDEDFIALCFDLQERGAHNIQILSPTVHLPRLRRLLKALKQGGFTLPILLKSSGYENLDELRKLDGLVDIYLPDFKFGPCSAWGRRAGVKDYFERSRLALEEMYRQVGAASFSKDGVLQRGVLVRHVKAPLPKEEFETLQRFFASLPEGVRVSVQDTFVSLTD